ncbi:hypothetical protein San01_61680 [Streptomyces angustmyceticus]|uniref:Uncharacterized protein n=1 Tax=Streptomyces angustmyceticus TaxID=285578 RepID=A0A5J4LQ66_9ACTN|nr:hypothetical protein San01_61680 [Streptomyces angustmyceticus]
MIVRAWASAARKAARAVMWLAPSAVSTVRMPTHSPPFAMAEESVSQGASEIARESITGLIVTAR